MFNEIVQCADIPYNPASMCHHYPPINLLIKQAPLNVTERSFAA